MKTKEIIKLGTTLGLIFKEETCFPNDLLKDIVVFDGVRTGELSLIDGNDMSDDNEILSNGRRLTTHGKTRTKNGITWITKYYNRWVKLVLSVRNGGEEVRLYHLNYDETEAIQ
ncbi:MAG: hypothetical protein U5L95_02620 [Candidatus Saccharibacteria bacterium]|nr:hypothetical protein [Candidatus Saccharibacteria bacterium]